MIIIMQESVFLSLTFEQTQQFQDCLSILLVSPGRHVDANDTFWSVWSHPQISPQQCEVMEGVASSLGIAVPDQALWAESLPEWLALWQDPNELPPVED